MKIISKKENGLAKLFVTLPLGAALSFVTTVAMAQQPPAPGNPPPPPPSPKELFDKVNPFKKSKKETKTDKNSKEKVNSAKSGSLPTPPPPNPIDLFKKKKPAN
ncbi:hypothetical protein [Mucilaginibacter boryungensis]|uniref:Uncharacterized protein n=1 Tax=Mucilaginibacter boryungensis TaxID=768480 RepID=A0ABR9XH49_9SPHI|nr:hypothetical protein [Mucilaginibacter boryungensis]MBE9666713.1 hypothetical protein [Mucilaginibacter boryungensis]